MITKLDDIMTESGDHNDTFHNRVALAEAYNIVLERQHYTFYDKIEPFAHKIEPKDYVHLSDTISCSFSKEHSQGCSCFGRGYVTIRMLSEQGIKSYIEDESKQVDYIKLKNGEELPMNNPQITNHLISEWDRKQNTLGVEGKA